MKKTFCGGLVALLVFCAAQLPKDHFQLTGAIQGADGQEIYLVYSQDGKTQVMDTARITAGTFTFSGKLDRPCCIATLYMGNIRDPRNRTRCSLWLEPNEMSARINDANFKSVTITGSRTQAESDELSRLRDAAMAGSEAIQAELETADHDRATQLRGLLAPYQAKAQKATIDFCTSHHNSYIVPYQMRFLMGRMKYADIKAIYDNLSDEVKKYGDVEDIEKELATLARIQPGASAPDFATVDVHGDSIRFSQAVKGKYVLLDFWASWCVPCRKSFPHVKALYDKYHAQGLEVFCVADNDSQHDAWKKAIQDDGVEKFFHVLRGFKIISRSPYKVDRSRDISDLYAVHFLPTKYLIDDHFRVIGKFSDEELDAQLQQIFGK